MTHGRRIALVLGALTVYFVAFGFVLGWDRLAADWWPLDRSVDGPNLYVSFVWVPLAAILAWAWSDARHEAHKAELRAMHDEHFRKVDQRLEAHGLAMTALLDATPGDRSIESLDEPKETP